MTVNQESINKDSMAIGIVNSNGIDRVVYYSMDSSKVMFAGT